MKRAVLAAILLSSIAAYGQAQDQYPVDRVFSYFDRNRDGKLDGEEYGRFPDSMKQAVRYVRLDFRQGVDLQTFQRAWPQMQGEMRAQRDRDASRGEDRGDGRSGDYRREESRREEPRREEASKPKSKVPPKRSPRPRVTVDLPTKFSDVDRNQDGQIGLYEWDRAKYREFFQLDQNGDGFLTPRELTVVAPTAPASRTSTTISRTSVSTPAAVSPSSMPPSETIAPVEFDPESSDGRRAAYVFRSLDRDKDGTLTDEEWQRSQSTRRDFEKKNLKPPLPATLEQFAGLYIALRKAR